MDQLLNHVRGFSFGGMTYRRGGRFGPILRPYLSVLMVRTGICTLMADGRIVEISEGQTGMAAADSKFEFDYKAGVETSAVWCEGFLPEGVFANFMTNELQPSPIATSDNMRQLCKIGVDIGYASNPELNTLRDAIGQAVCKTYLYEARLDSKDRRIPAHVLKARRFIEEHLGNEAVDLDAIAAVASVTPQHLITSFKKHTGTTPSRYLWRMRANRARQLLIHTDYSQSEIAFRCGYSSLPHYARSIKKLFGMTPGQLRKDMGFTRPSDTDPSVSDIVL